MFNTGILSLCIFPDKHGINIVVGCLEPLDGSAGSDIGKEIESTAQCQVEGNMTLPDCGLSTYNIIRPVSNSLGVARGPERTV
jgi:hypothetical protein